MEESKPADVREAPDAYAVLGRAPADLVRVLCMGTPIVVPREYALQVPLLATILGSGMVRASSDSDATPTVDLECPVTQFARVYEALVNDDQGTLSKRDLVRFGIPFDEAEPEPECQRRAERERLAALDLDPPVPEFAKMSLAAVSPARPPRDLEGGNLGAIYAIVARAPDAKDYGPARSRTSFALSRVSGSSGVHRLFNVARFCDLVDGFRLRLGFPPLPEGTIWRNDVVERSLLSLAFVVGGSRVVTLDGWVLAALAKAFGRWPSRAYRDVPFSTQCALSRHGFHVHLPMFPPWRRDTAHLLRILFLLTPLTIEVHLRDLCTLVYAFVDLPRRLPLIDELQVHISGQGIFSDTEERNEIAAARHEHLSYTYISLEEHVTLGSATEHRIQLHLGLRVTGFLLTWVADATEDPYGGDAPLREGFAWHPFTGVTLQLLGDTHSSYDAATLAEWTWREAGLRVPDHRVYYYPLAPTLFPAMEHVNDGAVNFGRIEEAALLVALPEETVPGFPKDWTLQVTAVQTNVFLYGEGMGILRFTH